MSVLSKLLKFYINSSIHVALSVYCLLRVTEVYFDLPYQENLNYFVFYGTIVAYNFVKYGSVVKKHSYFEYGRLKYIIGFTSICVGLWLYYGYVLMIKTVVWFLPFALLTYLYAIPFYGTDKKNLRNIRYLKIFLVAIVWAAVTVFIPVYSNSQELTLELLLYSIQRLLLVFVLTIPFEIRDVEVDLETVKTLPHKFGVKQLKKIGFVLLLIASVIEFALGMQNQKNVFVVFVLVLLVFVMRAQINQSKNYSSLWVESLPIFWWIVLWWIRNYF